MSHHVYVFWAGREPLYVGVTSDLPRRIRQHESNRAIWATRATHISTVAFESRSEAAAGEVECISSLRPLYNVIGNPRRQLLIDAMWDLPADDPWWAEQDARCAQIMDELFAQMRAVA